MRARLLAKGEPVFNMSHRRARYKLFRGFFNSDPAARGTGKTPGFISLLKMLTGVFQFAAPEHHHMTETLETVQFGVSNVPGGLLGPEISQVEGWPIVKNVTKISPEFHENKIILQLTQ